MDVSVLVSTYERPGHLRRCLAMLAQQERMAGRMEVIVTDDGSRDATSEIVAEFAARVSFPVKWTSHRHEGFQLARCRNEGVAMSEGALLLFLDGDCLAPPDLVWQHWQRASYGHVGAGSVYYLEAAATQSLERSWLPGVDLRRWITFRERLRVARSAISASICRMRGNAKRPKLLGGHCSLWREDFERVNGYDESFVGWGCEDDDLRARLVSAGCRIRCLYPYATVYHQWHPRDATAPSCWREGANVAYFERPERPIRCAHGLDRLATRWNAFEQRHWNTRFAAHRVSCVPSVGGTS